MIWNPYGIKRSQSSEYDSHFRNRFGMLYKIQYLSIWEDIWEDGDKNAAANHIDWSRKLYNYMIPYRDKDMD